ncbi:hypothetical protein [uncultured Prevotella sp.]|jgi:hypothetical protein|uniref:hypothetical protein n=1 Tax=uncultured Prevotella sp. TaxID=159272 RepID=UPI0027E276BC|nr:hypothetical protein [uncultured Prevotella sp.]
MITTKIDFVDNATIKEAGLYAVKYGWAFIKGICREIDGFVHRLPWLCIGAVIVVSFIFSFVCISDARAERDQSCKKHMELQTKVEQLSCVVESERSAK